MGFLLQIIYLNGSVLKLFTCTSPLDAFSEMMARDKVAGKVGQG